MQWGEVSHDKLEPLKDPRDTGHAEPKQGKEAVVALLSSDASTLCGGRWRHWAIATALNRHGIPAANRRRKDKAVQVGRILKRLPAWRRQRGGVRFTPNHEKFVHGLLLACQ
jgi:hypothetical protein